MTARPIKPLGAPLHRRLVRTFTHLRPNVRIIRDLLKRARHHPKQLVFLYAMRKTSSTSIEQALHRHYPSAFLRFHDINDNGRYYIVHFALKLWFLVKPSLIISPLRNPWERSMSAFLMNLGNYGQLRHTALPNTSTDELIERYFRALPVIIAETDQWFDNHIKKYLSFDVFAEPFPTQIGIKVYDRRRTRLLVLQAELPNTVKERALGEFVGCPITLSHANVGDGNHYGAAYRRFKKAIRFTPKQADFICASRYFRHFYSPDFIEQCRARWLAGES